MTRDEKREQRLLETLGELIKWSVEDSWSYADDIMPNQTICASSRRLAILLSRGFAENQQFPHEQTVCWRVTPAGRDAYQKHRELEIA